MNNAVTTRAAAALYSGNTPISFVTEIHRAVSLRKNVPTASTLMLPSAIGPIVRIRSATSLSTSSALTSRFVRSIAAAGVPAGATMANHRS